MSALRARQEGQGDVLHVDHVIAATGFRTDVSRLSFLSPSLRADIAEFERTPILSRNFESSIPGLHFIGPAAAVSFGPMMRFTFGARYAAGKLTRVLVNARRVPQTKVSAVSKVSTPAGTGF